MQKTKTNKQLINRKLFFPGFSILTKKPCWVTEFSQLFFTWEKTGNKMVKGWNVRT